MLLISRTSTKGFHTSKLYRVPVGSGRCVQPLPLYEYFPHCSEGGMGGHLETHPALIQTVLNSWDTLLSPGIHEASPQDKLRWSVLPVYQNPAHTESQLMANLEFFLYPGSLGNGGLHLRRTTGKGRSTRTFLPCFYPSTSAPSLLSPSNHPFAYCSTWFRIHSHKHSGQPAAWLDIILISFLVYLWRSQPYKSP